MKYIPYEPTDALRPFIKCYWSLEAPGNARVERQTIVPDGCIEMIFHYGDPYQQFIETSKGLLQPRAFVFGQVTTTLQIAPTGRTGIIAARFLPDGFAPFATMPISTMDNRAVPLSELFGDSAEELESQVLTANSAHERIKYIERFLFHRLATQPSIDNLARASVEILIRTKGQLSVETLAKDQQISRRQLERRFSSVIGLSPKQLSKIIRLQAALKLMEGKSFSSLASLAHESGYFDQAHFIKDFQEFTGTSPRQFYSDNMKISSLFMGIE